MTRLRNVRRFLSFAAAVLGLIVLYRFTRPVLFYIPSDCNCSDYSDRIDGFAVLNPFRNRAPEQAANGFLSDLRDGRESHYATAQLVSELRGPSGGTRRLQWRLKFRENKGDRVLLYYQLDATGAADIALEYGSEGMIEVDKIKGVWKADRFDVVW